MPSRFYSRRPRTISPRTVNDTLAIQVATLSICTVIAASLTNLMSGAIAGMLV
jgi:nucleoside permease NupC